MMKEIDGIYGNWSLIPTHMIGGMSRYLSRGILSGGFLTAMLCNDLRDACFRADDQNRLRLSDYVNFLYNYAPSESWGSPEKVDAWIDSGGLYGKVKEDADTSA